MKKATSLALITVFLLTLTSHSPIESMGRMAVPSAMDSTLTNPDSHVVIYDTLTEVEIKAEEGMAVERAIKKSLNNGLVQPRQKSVSDLIGSKTTDYIMHPFAWRERRKEKNVKKAEQNMKKLDAAKTYEEELTEAIYRQLREDSIADARKKEGNK